MTTGDLVVTAPPDPGPGDIVTFVVPPSPTGPGVVTHRVLSVTPDGIQTQGDANRTADAGLVDPQDVVGEVVTTVPNAGALIAALGSPLGLIALAAGMLAASLGWSALPRPTKPEPATA